MTGVWTPGSVLYMATTTPHLIQTATEGVTAMETNTKARNGDRITKRLYKCANGLSLGARRGGALHLSNEGTWEIFTIDERGVPYGESVGFVDEATLDRAVERLAQWAPADAEAI